VTLGRFSLQTFMPGDRISRVHGTSRPVDRASGARAATGYAMYHPAAALRQGALKETMQRDMAALPGVLIRARSERDAANTETQPSEAASTAPQPPPTPANDPPTAAPVAIAREEDEMHDPDDQLGLF
jgi:DNA polymerase